MKNSISTAQKALVLSKSRNKILVIKYLYSKYTPNKINGKLGIPGGQINFSEKPDDSVIREVREETGITITPSLPFYIWTWICNDEDNNKQIIAVARLSYYKSGKLLSGRIIEDESTIEKVMWVNIKDLKLKDFMEDEIPIIKNFLKYIRKNPFSPKY